jgi:hypothetical protein
MVEGGTSVKQRWVFAALSVLALSVPAIAEPVHLAQAIEARVLPPHEILTIVRSTGLDPIGRPVRQGPNYVLHAIDEDDREMRVIVSARRGEILRMVPAETPARMPPRGGVAAGPYERTDRYERAAPAPGYVTPDGYRYGARSPVVDDDDEDLPPSQQAPRPPGNVPNNAPGNFSGAAPRPGAAPLPRAGYADPPPVVRTTPPAPGSNIARGTDLPPPSGALPPPSGSRVVTTPPPRGAAPPAPQSASRDVYTPEPDRGGMLPPPPERFPQRVAPAPDKPKPVKREATAAAPKPAPVPKPKPATPVNAAAPKPAAPATTPVASPAAETKTEAVKSEAPKTETPRTEAPRTETPKPAAPAAAAPEPKPATEQKPAEGSVPH